MEVFEKSLLINSKKMRVFLESFFKGISIHISERGGKRRYEVASESGVVAEVDGLEDGCAFEQVWQGAPESSIVQVPITHWNQ